MANRKLMSIILGFLMLLSVMGLASATTTLTPPADSAVVGCGGFTFFNVTSTDGELPAGRVVNLTFYAMSVSTANSSWVTLATNNSLNLTLLANSTSTKINLTGLLEDSNDYRFNVTVKNVTGAIIGSDTNTGITVDCTSPVAPSALSPTSDTDGSVTFTSTVTGSRTTGCTLIFNGVLPTGGNNQAMTHSGDTCSLTINSVADQTYTWYVRASDGTNTTDSSTLQTTVDVQEGGGGGYIPGDDNNNTGNTDSTTGIIVIGAIILVAYLMFRKKK